MRPLPSTFQHYINQKEEWALQNAHNSYGLCAGNICLFCNYPADVQMNTTYIVGEVLGSGAVWILMSMPRFGETCCLHLQGLKWQGREVEGLYRVGWCVILPPHTGSIDAIWGSNGHYYNSDEVSGFGHLWIYGQRQRFRCHLHSLRMESACFPETFVSAYTFTRRQNQRLYQHDNNRHENLKSHPRLIFVYISYP
jgi:hypothetical protein